MGGRLSRPRGPDGLSEGPRQIAGAASSSSARRRSLINSRTIKGPLIVLSLAGLLFIYGRTSIQAAKMNAKMHRENDGGQIDWRMESMRRHGQMDKIESDLSTMKEALMADVKSMKEKAAKSKDSKRRPVDEE